MKSYFDFYKIKGVHVSIEKNLRAECLKALEDPILLSSAKQSKQILKRRATMAELLFIVNDDGSKANHPQEVIGNHQIDNGGCGSIENRLNVAPENAFNPFKPIKNAPFSLCGPEKTYQPKKNPLNVLGKRFNAQIKTDRIPDLIPIKKHRGKIDDTAQEMEEGENLVINMPNNQPSAAIDVTLQLERYGSDECFGRLFYSGSESEMEIQATEAASQGETVSETVAKSVAETVAEAEPETENKSENQRDDFQLLSLVKKYKDLNGF